MGCPVHNDTKGAFAAPDLSIPGGELPPVRAASAATADQRALGYLGTLWRAGRVGSVSRKGEKADRHPRRTSGHDLPERFLRTDWTLVARVKARKEKPVREAVSEVFEAQAEAIMRALREKQRQGQASAFIQKAQAGLRAARARKEDPSESVRRLVVEQLIDWQQWKDLLIDGGEAPDGEELNGMREAVEQVLADGYQTGANRVGVSGIDFTSDQHSVRAALEDILRQTRGTHETWSDEMARRIQRRLQAGDDFEEIEGAVRDLNEEQVSGHRRERVVHTAANGGFERGQLEAFKDAGIKRRAWLTERDSRVRGTPDDTWDHRSADGQEAKIKDPFFIERVTGGGEALRYPADPQGSPGNTVNCRCSQRPLVD